MGLKGVDWATVDIYCEKRNETSGSIIEEYLIQLRTHRFPRKDSAPKSEWVSEWVLFSQLFSNSSYRQRQYINNYTTSSAAQIIWCSIIGRFFVSWLDSPGGPRTSNCRDFVITLRHNTLGRIPLDERSTCRRHLYLTTHNTNDRHPYSWRDSNPQSQQANCRSPLVRQHDHWGDSEH